MQVFEHYETQFERDTAWHVQQEIHRRGAFASINGRILNITFSCNAVTCQFKFLVRWRQTVSCSNQCDSSPTRGRVWLFWHDPENAVQS